MVATKLKNLEVTKVDFVDAGANPDAHIKLFKKKAESGVSSEDAQEGIIKKIAKALSELIRKSQEGQERVEKKEGAEGFDEKIKEVNRRKILDEIWDFCFALHSSFASIIDEEQDSMTAGQLMEKSVAEFQAFVQGAIPKWATGEAAGVVQKRDASISKTEMQELEHIHEKLEASMNKAKQQLKQPKGESEEMIKIDKSKMTSEEAAAYEALVKKYGEDTTATQNEADPKKEEEELEEKETEKKKEECTKSQTSVAEEPNDIYKGLHPAVKAEMEALRKFREDAETKELTEVAKKYELIGKKPEELVPTLKSLKAAGGSAYQDMISVLDSAVAMAEQSGMFSEIGKSRCGESADPWVLIEKKAEEIQKAKPDLTREEAIDKACMQNPDLVQAYEEGR